ncbi:MAG: TonB-dependent receptor plug domain-containing protein, partial [Bacteroidales bacterium]|nr:TonB-dependent receptor plug domain-containing protein [Bacteroidales bacterium]
MRNRNFLRRIVFAGFLALLPLLPLSAQNQKGRTVSGTVYDETGERFPGVGVITLDRKFGVLTNADGQFVLTGLPASSTILVEIMGYKTQEFKVSGIPQGERLDIYLELDSETLQETVVTGIFTRRKDSFTGSVQTVTSDEIKKISNANVIASLKVIDPSMVVLENLAAGSDPNAMADIQIRGASTLSTATQSLKSDYLNSGNTPLFILDGFETSLQKITDMDMNRVQSITILKDASAKAIYGSKGANGVIVIETKRPESGKMRITYTGSMSLEVPDLTSYDLTNAAEKLEVERMAGLFTSDNAKSQVALDQTYTEKLRELLAGVETDWLAQPVRNGFGHKHSLYLEGGDKAMQYGVNLSFNRIGGAMKGSDRNTFSGGITLAYRIKNFQFRDKLTVDYNKSHNSPYGTFDQYYQMNPYSRLRDESGELIRSYSYMNNSGESAAYYNPLY